MTGPTASGKTALSINLAKKIDAEIICADSRIVYKGLDIVSAKPSIQEMEGILHHLIDIKTPVGEPYSAGDFCIDAKKSIEEIKVAVKDKLDLIIGDFELCNADMQFTKAGRLKVLKKAIQNIDGEYDFVIIDTPPNLGILSLNAFIASDYMLVPMTADSFSLKGVRLLKQTLEDVADETEKELPVAGILLTRYNSRTNVSRLLEKSLSAAAGLLGTKVFKNRIRQAVVLQECQIAKEDLFSYAANAKVTEDYRGFIDEFLERTGA